MLRTNTRPGDSGDEHMAGGNRDEDGRRPKPARRRPGARKAPGQPRPRCVAYHERTGVRCPRPVGRRPWPAWLCLCAAHARRLFLALSVETTLSVGDRRRLAEHTWRHAGELPR